MVTCLKSHPLLSAFPSLLHFCQGSPHRYVIHNLLLIPGSASQEHKLREAFSSKFEDVNINERAISPLEIYLRRSIADI